MIKTLLSSFRLALESRVNELSEEKSRLKNEIERLQKSLEKNSSTAISLREETMILQAKLRTSQCYQEEVEKMRKDTSSLVDEIAKLRSELASVKTENKDLICQRDRVREDYQLLKVSVFAFDLSTDH